MNTQHTEGPWIKHEWENQGFDSQECKVRDSEGNLIAASCFVYDKATEDQMKRHNANMQLIAAAPELLEVLQDCHKVIEHWNRNTGAEPELLDKIEEVLKQIK